MAEHDIYQQDMKRNRRAELATIAGAVSIGALLVSVLVLFRWPMLLVVTLPVAVLAGAAGLVLALLGRRESVWLPLLGAVLGIACSAWMVQAYLEELAVQRQKDFQFIAFNAAIALETCNEENGRLPTEKELRASMLSGTGGPFELAPDTFRGENTSLAVNRSVLGREMDDLPGGTVLLFERKEGTGLTGGIDDVTETGLKEGHVLLYVLPLDPVYVPTDMLGRYYWDLPDPSDPNAEPLPDLQRIPSWFDFD